MRRTTECAFIFEVVKPHLSFYHHDWPKANGLIQRTEDDDDDDDEEERNRVITIAAQKKIVRLSS